MTLDVAAGVAQDGVGNTNSAASQHLVVYDTTGPTVVVSTAQDKVSSAFTATFTFNEDVTGFAAADINVTNGSVSNFSSTSASVYTATITPTADGNVAVSIPASSAQDAATNGNIGSNIKNVIYETVKPTITINGPSTPQNAAFTVTFDFSEDVTGFTASDVSVGNASLSNFVSVTAAQYTATITPTSDGNVTVDVAAATLTDIAGNDNVAASQYKVVYDSTAPTVSFTGNTLINGTGTYTITFSEQVNDFIVSDITVTNASTSNFSAISSTAYTVQLTPVSDGAVTLNVAANVATDLAGNNNLAGSVYNITYDGTKPTPTLSGPTTPQNGPFTVNVSFDEDISGITLSDFAVGKGSGSNLQTVTANRAYSLTITPNTEGEVTVDFGGGGVSDTAGNGNASATQFKVTYDATKPTVVISSTAQRYNQAFEATFTFDEDINGFDQGDIAVTNGAASNVQTTSAKVYTATITPVSEGDVVVTVAADGVSDAANNGNAASSQYKVVYDTTGPTPTVSGPTTPQNTAFTATIDFGEDASNFEVSDITVINASLSNFVATNAQTYTVLVTPSKEGNVSVSVAASTATDIAGNANNVSDTFSVAYDTTGPTVTFSGPTTPQKTGFEVIINFTEDVTGFTVSDINAGNASLSNFQTSSPSQYKVQVTPSSDGNVTLDVNASVAQDLAGNGNNAAPQFSVAYDTTAPTVVISGPTSIQNGPFTATITFNEAVSGFTVDDITATNADLSDFTPTNDAVYTVKVTPKSDVAVTLTVAASLANDLAGNANVGSNVYSVDFDGTAPTVSISGPTAPLNAAFPITITFSEVVSGFVVADITVGNGSASNFVQSTTDSKVYTAQITPAADGDVTVDIAASVATDVANNGNKEASQFKVSYDGTSPGLTIKGVAGPISAPTTVTFECTETVTGFDSTDVVVNNGALSEFSGSGNTYTATLTPTADGNVTVDVAANVAPRLGRQPQYCCQSICCGL